MPIVLFEEAIWAEALLASDAKVDFLDLVLLTKPLHFILQNLLHQLLRSSHLHILICIDGLFARGAPTILHLIDTT